MQVLRGTLIDGTGRPPVPDGVLHVDGKRIVFAGPADAAPPWPPVGQMIGPDTRRRGPTSHSRSAASRSEYAV